MEHIRWLYAHITRKSLRLLLPQDVFPLTLEIVTTGRKQTENFHDPIKSGVSASMDNSAVCTFPVQLSSRSRKDFIC